MNYEKYKKKENENKLQHTLRLVGYKLEDKEDLDWSEIVEYCNLNGSGESLRKAMQHKEFGAYTIYKEIVKNQANNLDQEILDKITSEKIELKKEKQKIRDLRSGINEKIRLESRKEAILEEIRYYLKDVRPFPIPDYKELKTKNTIMIGGVADVHFGKEFIIEGINGDALNIYNEEIFYKRMENLFSQYVKIINEKSIKTMYFCDLGDGIEGILRQKALSYVKYGITESAIKYGNFMASWLLKLSKYVNIEYYGCKGNHTEYRILNSKSGDFPKENAQYIIDEIIRISLINVNRFNWHETKGLQYIQANGYNLFATHGQDEKGNLISSVINYKEIYGVNADLMITGHLHNSKQETASLHTKIIQFPSVIGIDDYSLKLKKTAKPEGKVILIEDGNLINMDILI